MKKKIVDKLSIMLRDNNGRISKKHFIEVSECFKEINQIIPNENWMKLWEMYRDKAFKAQSIMDANNTINEIDRKIYEITGIKTPLMVSMEKLREIIFGSKN